LRCEAPNYQTFIFDHESSIRLYLSKEATFARVESLTVRDGPVEEFAMGKQPRYSVLKCLAAILLLATVAMPMSAGA
jgi:hypothetical protein